MLKCKHLGEHTLSIVYAAHRPRQIRLFDLQLSANPIFVLNRTYRSDLVCSLPLGLVC